MSVRINGVDYCITTRGETYHFHRAGEDWEQTALFRVRVSSGGVFNCCGAIAVAQPWLAGDRALQAAGTTKKEVVNAALQEIMDYLTVSMLVQVDRVCLTDEDGDHRDHYYRGPWSEVVDLWEGTFTEGSLNVQNISEGNTVLSMFAFVNSEASCEDSSDLPYKQRGK